VLSYFVQIPIEADGLIFRRRDRSDHKTLDWTRGAKSMTARNLCASYRLTAASLGFNIEAD
jgi:hypothetical protein